MVNDFDLMDDNMLPAINYILKYVNIYNMHREYTFVFEIKDKFANGDFGGDNNLRDNVMKMIDFYSRMYTPNEVMRTVMINCSEPSSRAALKIKRAEDNAIEARHEKLVEKRKGDYHERFRQRYYENNENDNENKNE